MRVLAVEDDERIAADLKTALEAAGFRVETCSDGLDAWFLGDTEEYDLVILDLGMPLATTALEFRLLSYLMLHRDRVVPPTELLEHLYGDDESREANALEALIARLRRKLGPGIIGTRRGFGYFLEGGAA